MNQKPQLSENNSKTSGFSFDCRTHLLSDVASVNKALSSICQKQTTKTEMNRWIRKKWYSLKKFCWWIVIWCRCMVLSEWNTFCQYFSVLTYNWLMLSFCKILSKIGDNSAIYCCMIVFYLRIIYLVIYI